MCMCIILMASEGYVVSRSQTAFSSFIFGRRPNIKEENAVWLRETKRRVGRHSSLRGHRGLTGLICMAKILIPMEKL